MNSRIVLWVGLLCLFGGWPTASIAQPLYVGSWGISWPAGVTVDQAGVVYVTSTSDGTLRTYTREGVWLKTIASGLRFPMGIAVAPDRTIYVVEFQGSQVAKLDQDGNRVGQLAPLNSPHYVLLSTDGYLYVTDNDGISKFTADGARIALWPIGGTFGGAYGIVEDANGFVYAADWGNNCVWKYTKAGVVAAQWGSGGSGPGQFSHPGGLAIDPQGRLYVSDGNNCRIQRLTLDGQFIDSFGTQGSGPGQFGWEGPAGVAVGPGGETFVADRYNQRVSKFVEVVTATKSATWGRIKVLYR